MSEIYLIKNNKCNNKDTTNIFETEVLKLKDFHPKKLKTKIPFSHFSGRNITQAERTKRKTQLILDN